MPLPTSGPIGPLPCTRDDDRAAIRVPACWVHEREPVPLPAVAALQPVQSAAPPPLPADPSAPVLFLLAERPPEAALRALLQAADRGHRVYVLATAGFGEGQRDPGLRDRPRARVLVRRVPALPLSAILHDRGEAGVAWLGPDGGATARWCLPLAPEQAAELRRIFLQLYWHEATDEAWTAAGGLRFRAAAERPYDVPTATGGLRRVATTDPVECPAGTTVCVPEGPAPEGAAARLLCPPSGAHHSALATRAQGGTPISWSDLGLPTTTLGPGGALLLPRAGALTLRLPLTPAQQASLATLLDAAFEAPAWRFRRDTPLSELPDRPVWLADQPAAAAPVAQVELRAPSPTADELRAMAETTPPSWPAPPPLARRARTSWEVQPPRAPRGCVEDPLIGAWRSLDAEVARRIQAAREALAEAEGHQGRIGGAFQALLGALLGFGRKRGALADQLDALAARPPSARGPEAARQLLDALGHLEGELGQLRDDLHTTERKAIEDAERKRQEAAHDKATRDARQQLTERRGEQKNKQARRDELTRLLRDLEAPADDPQREKDRDATRKRWTDEASTLAKRLSALASDIAELEQRANRPFAFVAPAAPPRPAAPTGPGFVPRAAPRTRQGVPDEAPPAVGELLRQGSQRLLVVRRWEDLDEGERERARLGARLVAPAEGA